jgi:hypothetical protein
MQTETLCSPQLTEVFETAHGAVYQNDAERCWVVNFAEKQSRFDYRCLLKLRAAISRIDIEERLLDDSRSPDVEIIFICASENFYVLNLVQIIALRELLDGTFVMLELNQIINDRLYRLPA